jgi:hypothetical protein
MRKKLGKIKIGSLGPKAKLTFLQLCPKSANPKLKKQKKRDKLERSTGELSASLDQMQQSRIW